jgi:hypothetical protein
METDIARERLARQGIAAAAGTSAAPAGTPATTPSATTPSAAAARQLATQAQDFHGAKWALGLRSGADGVAADEVAVDTALADGGIVRSWPMRGTLMMMARDDVAWLTRLLAPRSFAASAGVWRRDGLVEGDFVRAGDVARDVLDDRQLGRPALLEAFAAAGLDTGGGRGSHLLRRLAGEALIVFGAPRGTAQTFALLDDRAPAPDAAPRDRDEALALLAERYVAGHGPTTVADLAWWSGLTLADTRRAVQLAGERVEQDPRGFLVPPGPDPALAAQADVHLLPPFDELLLGYRDRSASLAERDLARVVPYSNGLFAPTVVLDGVVVGIWRRTLIGADRVDVAVEPFGDPSPALAQAVEQRAREYGHYLGRAVRVEIGGTVGA